MNSTITARQLIGLPVKIADQPASQVRGQVARLVFDLDRGQVLAFIVTASPAQPQVLLRENVIVVDKDGVTASQSKNITPLKTDTPAGRAQRAERHVLEADALTANGQRFGTVIDVTLSLPLLTIEQFLVQEETGERLIPRSQAVMIGDHQVIFKNDLITGHLKWEAKAPVGAVPA